MTELPRSSSIYLHFISIPSHRLTWKVPMSHNFLCEARGMHSESWVTNCAMNLLGTPPIIPKRSENQTCVIKALCCTEGGGSLATRHAGPTPIPAALELETGGQSPANYPYADVDSRRKEFGSLVNRAPVSFGPKIMLVVQEIQMRNYQIGRATPAEQKALWHTLTRFTSNISVISGTNS